MSASPTPEACVECRRASSLRLDERPLPAGLAARADAHLAGCADCRAAAADLAALRADLAALPPLRASAGFTDRVLAARRARRLAGGEVLPFARRLAVAAALALAATGLWSVGRPDPLAARDATEATPHWVDAFRADPFAPDDLDAGLAALLRHDLPEQAFLRRAREAGR